MAMDVVSNNMMTQQIPQDDEKIERAVRFINERVEKASSSIIEIGEYLFANFFQSSLENVQRRDPQKTISLRKLAEHPDLNFSYSGLSRAVALAVQERSIGSSPSWYKLRPSHKILLLNVHDFAAKRVYADRVVSEGLSVKRLATLLTADGYIRSRDSASLEDKDGQKRVASGPRSYQRLCEDILEWDVNEVLAFPAEHRNEAFDLILKAKKRLEDIIAAWERHALA